MRARSYLAVIVLGTFFLVIFNLPSSVEHSLRGLFREGIASYQGVVTSFLTRVRRTTVAVGSMADVMKERDRLTQEVETLRASLGALNRLSRENQDLRELLGFRQQMSRKTVACQVIARDDGYGWWQTIRLDKGREQGLREDLAVIAPGGLVGKTIEVSGQTCDVLLISDRNFKASVRFEQEGSFGILHGGGVSLRGEHSLGMVCMPMPFQVDYVRKDLTIKPGETVVTSGLGGVFPSGLAVGQVARVVPDETGLYQIAEVTPTADLARLREVLVVVGE